MLMLSVSLESQDNIRNFPYIAYISVGADREPTWVPFERLGIPLTFSPLKILGPIWKTPRTLGTRPPSPSMISKPSIAYVQSEAGLYRTA